MHPIRIEVITLAAFALRWTLGAWGWSFLAFAAFLFLWVLLQLITAPRYCDTCGNYYRGERCPRCAGRGYIRNTGPDARGEQIHAP